MRIFCVVDLGFGDSGKGTCTDSLVRQYQASLIVRYNGSCQAGHNVYAPDGRHHTFSQIGATFYPKTYTLLSQFVLVNPLTLMKEAEHLEKKGVNDALNRVFIDNRCLLVTPYHRAVNRLREISRGAEKHGSCGAGVGECMQDASVAPEWALHIGDWRDTAQFAGKFMACRERMLKAANALPNLPDTPEVAKELSTFNYDIDRLFSKYEAFYAAAGARCLDEYQAGRMISAQKNVVFEGAQGILLDETYGFHPYTTWSDTTTRNAKLLLEEAEITEKPVTIGVMRTFMTRHGAGPFPTEDQGMTRRLADANNPRNRWQDNLRCGCLDFPLLRYAIRANGGVDFLAVTHLDKATSPWPVCCAYEPWSLPDTVAIAKLLREGKREEILSMQERAGLLLGDVKCKVETVENGKLLGVIERMLETPMGLCSYGRGPQDKIFQDTFTAKFLC